MDASLPGVNSWPLQNLEKGSGFSKNQRANAYYKIQIGKLVIRSATRKAVYQRDTTEVALAGAGDDAGNKAAA